MDVVPDNSAVMAVAVPSRLPPRAKDGDFRRDGTKEALDDADTADVNRPPPLLLLEDDFCFLSSFFVVELSSPPPPPPLSSACCCCCLADPPKRNNLFLFPPFCFCCCCFGLLFASGSLSTYWSSS